ncbi:carbohydrate esterase family 1 protein [Lentithecium fluviatile CBS 122367]|uniref:feruloyl esterase n=1 Tax=Lentithecium fluviatile CBS 122367 TaxID=1168545 RepID=A0A6G1IFT2_9PLEO|nr:carbohydrate esterase family 1 protein [Lentithecium fluviatile CBS 122367]
MASFSLLSLTVLYFAVGVASRTIQQSAGCGKAIPNVIELGKSKNLTIDSASGESPRKYRINVPDSYDPKVPVPLIYSFHGRNKDMKYQDELSQFSNRSFGFKGIAVYPEGVPYTKGSHPKQWQGDPDAPDPINDVTFTLELLDHLLDRYCIDPSRVYASGKSNGGGFTGLLACDPSASSRIAAFAAVSGAFYLNQETQQPLPCALPPNRKAVPVMELHGAKDEQIKYEGGPNEDRDNATTSNIPAWVNAWAERDGFVPSKNGTGSLCKGARDVKTWKWDETVVHHLYRNMGHHWPSQYGNNDTKLTTCAEADATKLILDWFGKWSL